MNKTTSSLRSGNVAVVTGAASGIGRALALALAARGMKLALADRNEAGLAETVALLPPSVETMTSIFDVSEKAANDALAAEVWQRFGRVDVVINNAGVAIAGSVYELSTDEIAWIMSINFWGVVHGTKAFLPGLALQKSGAIVNISSLYGLYAPPLNAAYAASKYAVRGFTEALRGEMNSIDSGVRIVTVYPGGVSTGIARSARFAAASNRELGRKRQDYFDREALTMTPAAAAGVITAGLDAGKERILIGRDTFFVDFLVRALGDRGVAYLNASVLKRLPPELRA